MSESYAIRMDISNEVSSDKKASRFHSCPYLPASIRLADIADIDTDGLLSHKGYLYFFIDISEIASDYHNYKLAIVEYSVEEPDTVVEYNLKNKNGYMIKFSKAAPDEDCTRFFGVESANLSDSVFMQYKASDFKGYNKELFIQMQNTFIFMIIRILPTLMNLIYGTMLTIKANC